MFSEDRSSRFVGRASGRVTCAPSTRAAALAQDCSLRASINPIRKCRTRSVKESSTNVPGCSTCPQNPAHGIPTEPSCRVGRGSRTPCRSQSRGGAATVKFNGVWESVNFVSSPSMGGVQCSGGVVQGAVSSRRYLSTRASVLHTRPTGRLCRAPAPPASGSSTAPVNWSTRAVTPQPAWRPVHRRRRAEGELLPGPLL